MLIAAIGIYIIITFILTIIGIESQSQGVKVFFLTLLLTPVYGIARLLKERYKSVKIHYYYCEDCNYIYPVKLKHCPVCKEKGKKVKLVKFENPYKLTKLYKQLSLA